MYHWWLYKENGEQIFKFRLESWQQITINIISPNMFHLDRVGNGNDDILSEDHVNFCPNI